ncbi:MAG: type 4a pilus biogenesis protein PilO [Methylomonas sp.]|jgi:type IV pilus assembly protein PilO|uniref:type 4a pilus biogenesis protein PilO n=1 Tax=Methylomonas sp. TaxID=418 RepID=UPI0025CBC57E|nr:type 4a pilus biogenesis protein PilO [Methylomonas sp.]MCK9607714.1 type 4a pilus biogenesis protein PilO [Methylomonas sp.]
MNLSEVNWDINAAGTWPTPIKIAAACIVSLLVVIADIYYVSVPQLDELEVLEKEEESLKASFERKQKKAINLPDYRDQLEQIESSLGDMLKQMPTKAEVANLLVDISQTGLASGLEFKLFQPSGEVRKEFYSELPINIQVVGKYEELGLFVSGLASLPRIVTVHNVNIAPLTEDSKTSKDNKGAMAMSAVIKTYNEGAQGGVTPVRPKRRGSR